MGGVWQVRCNVSVVSKSFGVFPTPDMAIVQTKRLRNYAICPNTLCSSSGQLVNTLPITLTARLVLGMGNQSFAMNAVAATMT
jgi:hypothetical protein